MTTRRNSGEGFGSMHPEERRRYGRRDEQTSSGRFENDYDSDFENRRRYYDDERENRMEMGDRTRRERRISDDEDYDSGRYGQSERGYNTEYRYGSDLGEDRYNESYRGQDQRSRGRYSEGSRNDDNRFFDENQYSRRGFGSMGRHKYENEMGYREHAWEPYSNGNRRSYSSGDRRREYDTERSVNRGYAEDQYSSPGMRGRNYDDFNQRNRGWDENRDNDFDKSSEKSNRSTTSGSRKKTSAKTTTKRGSSKK